MPKVRPEVPADLADRVDDGPDLPGDLLELVLVELVEVQGAVDAVEDALWGHAVRVRMKSVICSSSCAPSARRRAGRRGPRHGTRQPASAVKAEVRDVRALAMALVAALRLAQRCVGAGHVEDVVDDLEQDAELRSVAPIGPSSDAPTTPCSSRTHPTEAPIRRPVLSAWTVRRASGVVAVSAISRN